MERKRPPSARIIAGVIAAGGTPFAILLVWIAVQSPLSVATFSPGWFAYFALIWAAMGKRLRGDPLTTWVPCIAVNAFWAWALSADFIFDPTESATWNSLHAYVHVYVWAAVLLGIAGMIADLTYPQIKNES